MWPLGQRASRRLSQYLGTCDRFRQQADFGRTGCHTAKRRLREHRRFVRSSTVRRYRINYCVGRSHIRSGRYYGFPEGYVVFLCEVLELWLTLNRWGTICSVILVLVKELTDFLEVHEHGRYNLPRMASVPVYQSSHRKVPFGACFGLSGRQSSPGWIRHSRHW